jgi:hypothetical protein
MPSTVAVLRSKKVQKNLAVSKNCCIFVIEKENKMEKKYYNIYKKDCSTGAVTHYTYVAGEDEAKKTVRRLNALVPFPYTYFYL